MTFPGGTHDLWIRYWLAAGGIDPDKDVSTIVVPPPQMVANMKVGNMDAFCVGEPWNEQLVNQGIGFTACTTGEVWNKHPEKALGMRADWVDKNPRAAQAIIAAVMEAQMWCDKMENKAEMAAILGRRQWFNVPAADILGRLKGDINYGNGRVAKATGQEMKFWCKDDASYPFKSHDTWFLTENIRWGKFEPTTDVKAPRRQGEPRGHLARAPRRRRRASGPCVRHRAARRRSSTARSSIRKTPPPTSRASPSSASPDDPTGTERFHVPSPVQDDRSRRSNRRRRSSPPSRPSRRKRDVRHHAGAARSRDERHSAAGDRARAAADLADRCATSRARRCRRRPRSGRKPRTSSSIRSSSTARRTWGSAGAF